jgi:hypothetical protein
VQLRERNARLPAELQRRRRRRSDLDLWAGADVAGQHKWVVLDALAYATTGLRPFLLKAGCRPFLISAFVPADRGERAGQHSNAGRGMVGERHTCAALDLLCFGLPAHVKPLAFARRYAAAASSAVSNEPRLIRLSRPA